MGKTQATKSNFPKGKCKAIILLEATVFALSTAEYDSCSQSVYVVDIFSPSTAKNGCTSHPTMGYMGRSLVESSNVQLKVATRNHLGVLYFSCLTFSNARGLESSAATGCVDHGG